MLRIFLFHRKVMFRSRDIQDIFNHLLIYQICDVMMCISTSDSVHFLNMSFGPQLINPSNLVN